jgi:aminopeptidase N
MKSRGLLWLGLTALITVGLRADTYPRQPGIDVEQYIFELEVSDATDEIVGRTTIEMRFLEDGVDTVTFDLIGKDGPEADSGMEVTGVSWLGVEGAADYKFADDRLSVRVPEARRGEIGRVAVSYRGRPATGLIIGDNKHGDRGFFSDNWPIKARHWLVTVDHPYDKAASQMVVTAPSHYQVISNGLMIEETDLLDGRRLTHWKQSVPIATWLNVLGVARFAVQHLGEVNDIPIQTWVYAQDRDAGFYDFAVPTPHALEFYADAIGPYAYEKLANVQSNSAGGGMESATAIFYSDSSVKGDRGERWRNVIIHEVAHQWWGNAVTESDWDDAWLSEGFATYFTDLFIEHAYGRDELEKMLRKHIDYIFNFAKDNPDYTIVHDNLDDMSKVLTGNIYQKGGMTLHMLRELIGDEAFWVGIRDYYARFMNSNASTDDFRHAMEQASKRDLEGFFDQWLHRGGGMELDATWSHDAAAGTVEIALRQVHPNGLPYTMPLDIMIRDEEGNETVEQVELTALRHDFSIATEGTPVEIELDPSVKLLARSSVGSR